MYLCHVACFAYIHFVGIHSQDPQFVPDLEMSLGDDYPGALEADSTDTESEDYPIELRRQGLHVMIAPDDPMTLDEDCT